MGEFDEMTQQGKIVLAAVVLGWFAVFIGVAAFNIYELIVLGCVIFAMLLLAQEDGGG